MEHNEILRLLVGCAPCGMGSQYEVVTRWIFKDYFSNGAVSRSTVSRMMNGRKKLRKNLVAHYSTPGGKVTLSENVTELLKFYPGVSAKMHVYAVVTGQKLEQIGIVPAEKAGEAVADALIRAMANQSHPRRRAAAI